MRLERNTAMNFPELLALSTRGDIPFLADDKNEIRLRNKTELRANVAQTRSLALFC